MSNSSQPPNDPVRQALIDGLALQQQNRLAMMPTVIQPPDLTIHASYRLSQQGATAFDIHQPIIPQLQNVTDPPKELPANVAKALRDKIVAEKNDRVRHTPGGGTFATIKWSPELSELLWYLHMGRGMSAEKIAAIFDAKATAINSQLQMIKRSKLPGEYDWSEAEIRLLVARKAGGALHRDIAKEMDRKLWDVWRQCGVLRVRGDLWNVPIDYKDPHGEGVAIMRMDEEEING